MHPNDPKPTAFLAGAASSLINPPLGLPMSGVVRRVGGATGQIAPLEVTALALSQGTTGVILCGVDTIGIQAPEADEIRRKISARTGINPAGILLNWNHSHHVPPGCRSLCGLLGDKDPEPSAAVLAYIGQLHATIVETCVAAWQKLEPAAVRWGVGEIDESINRRQRDPDGKVTKIGWNPDGLVDRSVTVLQATRPDGSPIATLVNYGCHTVTTGINRMSYSPDYPGPMRDFIRRAIGGECIFFQGAAGNVMPRIAFEDSGASMQALGRRVAIEALHALADQRTQPQRLRLDEFASGTGLKLFRWENISDETPTLSAAAEEVEFPLLPLPSLEEVIAARERSEKEIQEAEARGAQESELRILRFHGLIWARRTEAEIRSGSPRKSARGSIHAVRIGKGVIATGPGEIFTEIGLAVKERSPADVTMYAGYTNGIVTYFPTAAEYPLGGYEPNYGNKPFGLPTQVSPDSERILTQTAVTLIQTLFPERPRSTIPGWIASGQLPKKSSPPEAFRPADF